jgi:DNA-binding GntR family transcriptional regulator
MTTKSRTTDTYERLRREILNAQHLPRAKLRIDQLAGAFGVSPGAVREALSRLTSDGLVVAEPQRGFVVAPISTGDLTDLTAVRIEIETRCLRRAILIGDLAWEARIVAALYELSRTSLDRKDAGGTVLPNDDWTRRHSDFHDALIAACDSRWWLRLREQLYIQAERYRRMGLPYGAIKRDVAAEHQAIADAALARDSERACGLLTAHLQHTADILLASNAPFDDVPAPPVDDVPALSQQAVREGITLTRRRRPSPR